MTNKNPIPLGKIAELAEEFKVIKKYADSGYINQRGFSLIENEIKSRILQLCGMVYLEADEQIFKKIG